MMRILVFFPFRFNETEHHSYSDIDEVTCQWELKIYSEWEACWAFCLQQLQGRKCFTQYWQIHKFFLFCQRKKGHIPLQLVFNALCRKEATELKRLREYYSEQIYEQINRIELKCWNPPTPRGDTFSCLRVCPSSQLKHY